MNLIRYTVYTLIFILLSFALVAQLLFKLPPAPGFIAGEYVISNSTIINPMIDTRVYEALMVKEGKIVLEEVQQTPSSRQLTQYKNTYILPGLVNMHSHSPSKNLLNLGPMFSLASVMHGVTTWRDALDPDGTSVSGIRDQITKGEWPTPYIFSCGVVTGSENPRWNNSYRYQDWRSVDQLLEKLVAEGYDCIKSYENLTKNQISELVRAAKSHNLQVIGHVPEGLTLEEAMLPDTQHFFGVPSNDVQGVIERNGDWSSVDNKRINEVAQFIVENKLANTPTLVTLQQLQEMQDAENIASDEAYQYVPWFYPEIIWHPKKGIPVYRDLDTDVFSKAECALRKKLILLKALNDQDATLNIGTDTQQPFVVPGVAFWQEMKLFSDSGIDPEEIWAKATWKARSQLPNSSDGLIRDGAEATFLIFDQDPTADLENMNTLRAVVLRGRLYDIDDLKANMQKLRLHYEKQPLKFITETLVRRSLEDVAKNFTH